MSLVIFHPPRVPLWTNGVTEGLTFSSPSVPRCCASAVRPQRPLGERRQRAGVERHDPVRGGERGHISGGRVLKCLHHWGVIFSLFFNCFLRCCHWYIARVNCKAVNIEMESNITLNKYEKKPPQYNKAMIKKNIYTDAKLLTLLWSCVIALQVATLYSENGRCKNPYTFGRMCTMLMDINYFGKCYIQETSVFLLSLQLWFKQLMVNFRKLYTVGYSLSLFTLTTALIILLSFRWAGLWSTKCIYVVTVVMLRSIWSKKKITNAAKKKSEAFFDTFFCPGSCTALGTTFMPISSCPSSCELCLLLWRTPCWSATGDKRSWNRLMWGRCSVTM